MTAGKVHLWGFRNDEVRLFPTDVDLAFKESWTGTGLLMVHVRAIDTFLSEVHKFRSPDGRLPDAILYLPKGMDPPKGAWAYFDAIVREGDWQAIRDLARCPRQFLMAEMVEDLPATLFFNADQPITSIPLRELPLPQTVLDHLEVCDTCREQFNHVLEKRIRWRRQLFCPDVATLATYAQGMATPHVQKHLESCPMCRAELAILQGEMARVWVLPLQSLAVDVMQVLAKTADSSFQAGVKAIGTIVDALLRAGLQPVPALIASADSDRGSRVRRVSVGPRRLRVAAVLERLWAEKSLRMSHNQWDLSLTWDPEAQTLSIEHQSNESFDSEGNLRIEVRRGDEELWSGIGHGGRLRVPVAALSEAFEAGADQLLLRMVDE